MPADYEFGHTRWSDVAVERWKARAEAAEAKLAAVAEKVWDLDNAIPYGTPEDEDGDRWIALGAILPAVDSLIDAARAALGAADPPAAEPAEFPCLADGLLRKLEARRRPPRSACSGVHPMRARCVRGLCHDNALAHAEAAEAKLARVRELCEAYCYDPANDQVDFDPEVCKVCEIRDVLHGEDAT